MDVAGGLKPPLVGRDEEADEDAERRPTKPGSGSIAMAATRAGRRDSDEGLSTESFKRVDLIGHRIVPISGGDRGADPAGKTSSPAKQRPELARTDSTTTLAIAFSAAKRLKKV